MFPTIHNISESVMQSNGNVNLYVALKVSCYSHMQSMEEKLAHIA